MGKNTKIEWATATWNPWDGCQKVSKGCKFCYMYRHKNRFHEDATVVTQAPEHRFNLPKKWNNPEVIFTCSMSDFFIKDADNWRMAAFEIMKNTPHHTYLILTKRIDRVLGQLPPDWGKGYPNVWIGVSVESQKTANYRIPKLWEIPAKVRFLSIEPILEQIDIKPFLNVFIPEPVNDWVFPIHWVIVGGETGNDNGEYIYRPAKLEWFREIIAACAEFEVPVFVKQLGTGLYRDIKLNDRSGSDFEDPNFPALLKKREFPVILDRPSIV
jgi:protein gp37